ncbi:class C sortase [uncultured Bifidobacterium sp.]|uniref:class C sortase n=1 Tax=uncultured Bifidobacterium sp. TaxID=165187 RepID=UPI00258B4B72|nr:class C sortase [uncultured Bifidobacterium sp.]
MRHNQHRGHATDQQDASSVSRPDTPSTAGGTQTEAAPSGTASPGATAFVPNPGTMPELFAPDHAERMRRARSARLQARIFTAIAIICAIVGVSIIGYPYALQFIDHQHQAQLAAQVDKNVNDWPPPQAKETLAAARAYNRKLAAEGQPTIGEAQDPFTADSGRSTTNDDNDSMSAQDATYMSLLNASNDGIMGSIVIPQISVNLPIYHGTSANSLNRGSGHLYGTSLPVGGKNTHAVLTGHRGMVSALMFTRIDELKQDDDFYVKVMGETLAYQVDSITVILPTEGDRYLRIRPGEDRVTLMTCTPYGVNTHRLLVSGHRVRMPAPAPYPQGARSDSRLLGVIITAAALAITLIGWTVLHRNNRWMPIQHTTNRHGY